MTRERIAGFLFGLSVGTAIGFLFKPPENGEEEIDTTPRDGKPSETPKNQAARIARIRSSFEMRKRA